MGDTQHRPLSYVKKPVEIQAFHFNTTDVAHKIVKWIVNHTEGLVYDIDEFFVDEGLFDELRREDEFIEHPDLDDWAYLNPKAVPFIVIPTLEGRMRADIGDYIIRGVNGEFYPCKPDIFWKSYDLAGGSNNE